jgi:glutamate mutase epsilon subunit
MNIRDELITEKQLAKIQAMAANLYAKSKQVEFRDRVKTHFGVPSFWQLTRQEASEVIEKLLEVEKKREQQQPKLL